MAHRAVVVHRVSLLFALNPVVGRHSHRLALHLGGAHLGLIAVAHNAGVVGVGDLIGINRMRDLGGHAASRLGGGAQGSVAEVESILSDSYLTAPTDGEISDIFPNVGELVSLGAPIMNVLKLDDMWVSFNVREDLLENLTMGAEVQAIIPALENKEVTLKVFYIRDMGSYAVWRATKVTGQYDAKTFQVKARPVEPVDNLRPGMSVLLKRDKK